MPGGIRVPIEVYATWPPANYTDPVTQPRYVLIAGCIITPISFTLLCLRLWVRLRIQRNAGLDDLLILLAYIPLMGLTVLLPILTDRYFCNRHIWDIEPQYRPVIRIFLLAVFCLFTLSSGLIKISVLLFFRRLSTRTIKPIFQWTLLISIIIIALYTAIFSLTPLWECSPMSAFWEQTNINLYFDPNYKYKCVNEGVNIIANSILSTIQDLLAALLPSVFCWKIQIPIRQKLGLYAIFATSYFTVAMGALRTYEGYHIYFETYDVTWPASFMFVLMLLELHLGTMCANAPSLKALYQHYSTPMPSLASKQSQYQSHSSGYTARTNNRRSQAASSLPPQKSLAASSDRDATDSDVELGRVPSLPSNTLDHEPILPPKIA